MRRLILVLLFILAGTTIAQSSKPNVLVVVHGSQVLPVALKDFQEKFGNDACDCDILREDEVTPQRLARAKAVFFQHPTAEFLDRTKSVGPEAVKHGMKVVTDVPEFLDRGWGMAPTMPLTARVMPYWNNGGEHNMLGMLALLYVAAGGPKDTPIPPLEQVARMGVYHPDAPHPFANLDEYLKWYRQAKPHQGALVTVNFFYTYLKDQDTAVVDALLRALEKQGFAAAGVYGTPHSSLVPIFNQPASDPIRVMLMFTLALAKPDDRVYLEKQNIHVIDLMTTRQSLAEWEKSDKGVIPDRVNTMLSMPEMNGATEPILVSTTENDPKTGLTVNAPIEERVHAAALRAKRWVALSEKPNADKKIAILYYNNPPGKGNLGASYLNLAPSIRAVLQTLHDAGYKTGDTIPTAEEILAQLDKVGRNVENWAPGELDTMVRKGGATLLPVREYETWFRETPKQFQDAINARWGKPEDATLMTWKNAKGEKFFVIPGVHLGNIFLGPQLLRSSFAEYTAVQHSATLPPHHGYVASYLWYRHAFGADAVIHMGRHGTLEWLPGKNAGQAGWDTSEVLLGDLPNVNYYIMDGGGEALQARRRSAAVLISHLTPILVRAGLESRFLPLNDLLNQWEQTHETSPALASEYEAKALAELDHLGLAKQLSLDTSRPDECMEKAIAFLDSVEEAPLPLGLPTLGQIPSEDRQRAGLLSFLGNSFMPDEKKQVEPYLQAWSDAIFSGKTPDIPPSLPPKLQEKCMHASKDAQRWLENLRLSPARELTELPKILRGEYLPSGPVGDPLGVPDALPSGRDLHQGDPAQLPTRAAWELGKKMGDQLLDSYKKAHGTYPDHISMILWQGETGRNQGAMEAEAMYLMGVQPEWNGRGVVDRMSLIPDALLGHPRVNVVFTASGLYRDGLAEKIIMLDRASRLAASAGNNPISRQTREVEQALLTRGIPADQAKELAGARVFASAPGSYGFGLSNMVEQSRDKDEPTTMAELYLSKMNYVYSEKTWGATVPKLLQEQLKGNQTILHSRSSNLYGSVDNDDVYQYMGGLRIASATTGAKPELIFNDLRHPGQEKVQGAKEFIATELNARNWNPKWIEEMQKEGYSGAREMMKATENLYGWQATAPETVSPEVWKKMYDVYVADEYKLGVQKFMEHANPAARQAVLGRLLEIDRQGIYKFAPAEKQQLLKEFVENVRIHGVACSANICGNRKLVQQVSSDAEAMPQQQLSTKEVKEFDRIYKRVTSRPKPSPAVPAAQPKVTRTKLPNYLNGYKVTYVKVMDLARSYRQFALDHLWTLVILWCLSILAGVGLGFARRRWIRHTFIQLMPR